MTATIEQMLGNLPDQREQVEGTVTAEPKKNEIDLSLLPDQPEETSDLWEVGIDTAMQQARENL
jgi:hypothetical protein